MWLCLNNKKSVEIDPKTVRDVLGIYSEEKLVERDVFKNALNSNSIEYTDLREESEKILIPWQFFFLDNANLQRELSHINKMRLDKVSEKLMAKRKGVGDVTSRRIIDRLIRLQNFICSEGSNIPQNVFCGSLIGKGEDDSVKHILSYFDIQPEKLRKGSKKSALEYLIQKIESRNINVSRGVLTNKILPAWQVVENSVYKNTSGFVIKDSRIPFVFLPSEINPDETDGRQIYTLIYLIVLIGLNEYDFSIDRNFKAKAISAKGQQAKIYRITSELLLPSVDTEKFRGQYITPQIRDELSAKYKITPTAVLVTLRIRKIISSKEEYESLLPIEYVPQKGKKVNMRAPGVDTSVRKFCGKYPFEIINHGIKTGSVNAIQAQYLFFGGVNKKGFKKYRAKLKL